MCRIKVIYKTSFSQSQGNKTLLTVSQQSVHPQSVTFSQLRNPNRHKSLNKSLQLILLCFYCTVSPCNEAPEHHVPADTKLQVGFSQVLPLAPNCSWHSLLSGAPQTWCLPVNTPAWQEFLPRHKANAARNNAQCQLIALI